MIFIDPRRQQEASNREAIYKMLTLLFAMAQQQVAVSAELACQPMATETDRRALTDDMEVRNLLRDALYEVAAATERDLEDHPTTTSYSARMNLAFQLSDEAIRTAMRISHSVSRPIRSW